MPWRSGRHRRRGWSARWTWRGRAKASASAAASERFAFENDFQLKHLRRVLNENWRRLPESVATANKIEIEVKWSEKAGTKRVITDEDAEMTIGPETFSLPYHVCLSELIYGEPLYRQRRVMWGLPLPGMPAAKAATDGGASAPDGARVPAAGRRRARRTADADESSPSRRADPRCSVSSRGPRKHVDQRRARQERDRTEPGRGGAARRRGAAGCRRRVQSTIGPLISEPRRRRASARRAAPAIPAARR